jgi:hypothetical protein
METNQEVVTQETLVQETLTHQGPIEEIPTEGIPIEGIDPIPTPDLRRPPRRPAGTLTAQPVEAVENRLKSERVEEMLRQMPGWKLLPGGRAIDRVRDLATPEIAADYAAWVLRSAARLGRCVGVRLIGGRYLCITLEGKSGPSRRSLSEGDLDFAKCLG